VPAWRDYSHRQARLLLHKNVQQCRAFSLSSERWRSVYWLDEPEEFFDLGRELSTAGLRDQLLDFLARRKHRSTVSDAMVERGTHAYKQAGVFFGQW